MVKVRRCEGQCHEEVKNAVDNSGIPGIDSAFQGDCIDHISSDVCEKWCVPPAIPYAISVTHFVFPA